MENNKIWRRQEKKGSHQLKAKLKAVQQSLTSDFRDHLQFFIGLESLQYETLTLIVVLLFRAIFVWPWKMVSVSVRYLFYQPMDEKIKTWTLHFPAKENPNMEMALLDKVLGHEVFSPERSRNQSKATRVCIRSINQANRSISVRLLFLFCSLVFISRS